MQKANSYDTTSRVKVAAYLVMLTGAILVSITGCRHDPAVQDEIPVVNDPGSGDTTDNKTAGCDPDTVYFANDILPIIRSSCARSGCHDAGTATKNVVLDNYENIVNTGDVEPFKPDNSKLFEFITDEKPEERMPPMDQPQLTPGQITLIRRWIAQGALNNECRSDCDTTSVTYSGTIEPIVRTYCINCHSGATPQGNISLASYAQVSDLVASQRFQGAVNHLPGYTAMPYGGAKLPDCELTQIRIWIENGAKND